MNTPPDSGLPDALEQLYRRNLHVMKFDLEPVRAVLEEMGDPQDQFLSVHVAGTNGKGMVTAMMASILEQAGLTVGQYTSPHLVRFHERLQVNGAMIDDAALREGMERVEAAEARAVAGGVRPLTFFEFTTALGFDWFSRRGVHAAAVETGMGGRLDATNVVTPAVSVITSIGLEHTRYLGDTLAKIAGEKAGIIKPGRPVVAGDLPGEAMAVVAAAARRAEAPLFLAGQMMTVRRKESRWSGQTLVVASPDGDEDPVEIPFLGPHPVRNAALAAATALVLRDQLGLPLTWEDICGGLAATRLPARTQVLSVNPLVILDGAHNPPAASVLAKTLAEQWKDRPLGMVVGFLDDKEPANFMKVFKAHLASCWIAPIASERALFPEDVQRLLLGAGMDGEAMADVKSAVLQARRWAAEEGGIVLITGSFYLAGEVLALRERGELEELVPPGGDA